ncbi:hypothetical protein [Pseudoxanthomonas koreensis]|uniref:hypothetical protein n=1 Tax=Pseudoxanthomonas koreensis TaxID=266061 RepID=UPI00139181FE|nr:hypothetical protein [Pseudoxanthomonas koreensis]
MTTLYPTAVDPIDPLPSTPDRSDDAVLALQKRAGTVAVVTGDAALPVADGISGEFILTKGSAAAITLAAPTATGQRITVTSASAYAHVVTATGLIHDGTTGAHNTVTFAAFAGASVTLVGYSGKWHTQAAVAATIA